MNDRRFSQPVCVLVGLGLPHQVNSVFEAYQLLTDWHGGRNPAHAAALNTCRAALADEVDAEIVRSVFEAFARRTGILVPKLVQTSPLSEPQRHTFH